MYEWSLLKSQQNYAKHGISIEDAKFYIFEGSNVIAPRVAYETGEVRHAVCGKFKDKYYTGILTVRNSKIRIICVRRARPNEEKNAKEKGI